MPGATARRCARSPRPAPRASCRPGFAPGFAPPGDFEALKEAVAKGVVVVQCTRAGSGRTFRGTRLANAGFLIADNLLPQKARILLALALTVTREPERIAEMFRAY